jgi:hypothetical protein
MITDNGSVNTVEQGVATDAAIRPDADPFPRTEWGCTEGNGTR